MPYIWRTHVRHHVIACVSERGLIGIAADPPPPTRPMKLTSLQRAFDHGDIDAVRRIFFSLSEEERRLLRQQLGDRSYRLLKGSTQTRSRGERRGRVILLHGIMGANLDVQKRGSQDRVWVKLRRINQGRLRDLALDAVGEPKSDEVKVFTAGQNAKYYMPTFVELAKQWHVRPFAYDWRLDIRKSADRLAALVQSFSAGGPVHFVAHSMGGLVVRSFIQRHPNLWRSCIDPNGLQSGGRLVQLGTPNHGAFVIPRVFLGQEGVIRKLALFDFKHKLDKVLAITDTFPGTYQMMPAHWHPDSHRDFYRASAWGGHPLQQANLDDARQFQDEIKGVVDPERFLYVAGCSKRTPVKAERHSRDIWRYKWTRQGDGRVSHRLGLLDDVPTWFVHEDHGDLTINKRVLRALHDLLGQGSTESLTGSPPLKRGDEDEPDVFEARPDVVPAGLEELVKKHAGGSRASKSGRGEPEEALHLTAFEEARMEALILTGDAEGQGEDSGEPEGVDARTLKVEVVWGDITKVDADAYAVGHYEGIEPQNALKAIDVALSGCGWDDRDQQILRRQEARGNLSGAEGRVTFFPWGDSAVVVVGMGQPGTFTMDTLRAISHQLAWSVAELPHTTEVACVLIGSGEGTLNVAEAVEGLVQGIGDFVSSGDSSGEIKCLRIVEVDRRRASEIQRAMANVAASPPAGLHIDLEPQYLLGVGGRVRSEDLLREMLRISTSRDGELLSNSNGEALGQLLTRIRRSDTEAADALANALASSARAAHSHHQDEGDGDTTSPVPIRMSFSRDVSGMRASAISEFTTVAERLLAFDPRILDELLDRVELAEEASVLEYASVLTRLLLPREFRQWIGQSGGRPVVFEVDRAMAEIPWETLHREHQGQESAFLALRVPVSRQIRTTYSPAPSLGGRRDGIRRALVVGDPGDPSQHDDLPGARREAIIVSQALARAGVQVTLLIGSPKARHRQPRSLRVDVRPASRVELMGELLRGNYDLLHYAGHGDFDPAQPGRAGWLFSGGLFTGAELSQVDEIPPLVVANACLSARTAVQDGEANAASRRRETALVASLADEFFRRGARHYIGTAWTVDDEGAIEFAKTLYDTLLDRPGATVGEAVLRGRQKLFERKDDFGQLWAAYQHYGDPNGGLGV